MKGASMPRRIFLNGRLLPASGARVSVFDRGFLFGDGIYETFRSYAGRPFRMRDHIARLARSARRVSMQLPFPAGYLERAVARVLSANRLEDARIRIVVTRGKGIPLLTPPPGERPTVLVYALPLPEKPDALSPPVRTVFSRFGACAKRAPDPSAKTLCLLASVVARLDAHAAGAQDAIMLDCRGYITEAVSSNVFFVRGEEVCTPCGSCGILPGVTRAIVMRAASRLGLKVHEGRFKPAALLGSDEVFLTSSIAEIRPVSRVGSKRFACPGLVTRALGEAYRAGVRHELGL
jgi:branched-chain amino acid aminotransferase